VLLYAAALGKTLLNDAFGNGIVDLKRQVPTSKA